MRAPNAVTGHVAAAVNAATDCVDGLGNECARQVQLSGPPNTTTVETRVNAAGCAGRP